jgi:hypothetical protein
MDFKNCKKQTKMISLLGYASHEPNKLKQFLKILILFLSKNSENVFKKDTKDCI